MQITDYILQEFKYFKFCAVYQQRMSGRQALPVLETIESVLEECADACKEILQMLPVLEI